MNKKHFAFNRFIDVLAILTFLACFTPLVIPQNQSGPFLIGIPYTMWIGFFVSIFFVFLGYLVSLKNKGESNDH